MTLQRPLPEMRPAPPRGVSRALPRGLPQRRIQTANATLVARADVTATLAEFALELDEPLQPYAPGQYVSVGLDLDGVLVQRPYSIVSLDGSRRRIELFVRRLPDGRLSNALWALPTAARLRVGQARGLFTLDSNDDRPRLMVGTGTGLAPLLAMLGDAVARGDETPTTLIHGVSFHAELAYANRLTRWISRGLPLDYRPTVSRPREKRNDIWIGRTGRADSQLAELLAERPELRDANAYLCGNPDMIAACRSRLMDAGMTPASIRSEHFHAPAVPRVA